MMFPLLFALIAAAPSVPSPAKVEMFDAAQVKLLGGPFHERQEWHRTGYVGNLDVDRLLFPYRALAGISQPSPDVRGYDGWDQGFIRGHMAGHYLSAASRLYAATGDVTFRDKANQLVDGLAECQDKLGTGHLAAFPEEVLDLLESQGKSGHGIFVPYYTIHKVLAGLLDAHHYLGNERALQMAEKMADRYAARMAALTPAQIEKLLRTDQQRNPLNEFGGMSDALAELAVATGNNRHLELARVFIRDWFEEPLANGEDRLRALHANTHVAQAAGMARYAAITGDPTAAAAAKNFWELVAGTRSFVIGGNSFKEWFDAANVETGPSINDGKILPYNTAETCNTHNMLKLAGRLFELQPSARLAAFHERALWNHLLSSIDPETGRVTYFHPLYGDFKTYLKGTECCDGSGIENTGRYGEGVAFTSADTLWINLYLSSEITWTQRGLVIRQEGIPPYDRTLRFTVVRAGNAAETTIALRVPDWLAGEPKLEGAGIPSSLTPEDGYLRVRRAWKAGDTFALTLPAGLRLERSKDDPHMVSILYGPLVLAAPLGTEGMPDPVNSKDVAAKIPRPEVPAIVSASADPAAWTEPVDPGRLHFRFKDAGPASGLELRPVYEVHRERFSVYFPLLTPSEFAALPKAEKPNASDETSNARDLAMVQPGDSNSESRRDLASERSTAGTGPQGRRWRDAAPDGWFSYTLAVEPDMPLELVCTYWGDDHGRTFDVQVNGRRLAEQTLERNQPARFFDVVYPIPAGDLKGQQNVNVRFQGLGKGRVGGVFGVTLRRRE
jgi:hypothetical protein